jgi:heme A synthase
MKLYRVLASLIALEVVIQAAAIAFGMAGLGHWVYDEGHVATRATFEEGGPPYTGDAGFELHGTNGALLIPILGLAFLVVGFLTRKRVPRGLTWSAIVFGLVAMQVALGFLTLQVYWLGAAHGVNALVLFAAAAYAALRVRAPARAASEPPVAGTPAMTEVPSS